MAPDEGRAARVKRHMRAYRARRRAEGMRLVQLWAPDTRQPEFLAAAKRQSLALHSDPAEDDIMDWIEGTAEIDDPR